MCVHVKCIRENSNVQEVMEHFLWVFTYIAVFVVLYVFIHRMEGFVSPFFSGGLDMTAGVC